MQLQDSLSPHGLVLSYRTYQNQVICYITIACCYVTSQSSTVANTTNSYINKLLTVTTTTERFAFG